MAPTPARRRPRRTVCHLSHDAQARVDARVVTILAERDAALRLARSKPRPPKSA